MPIFYRWVIAVLTLVTALPAHAGEPQAGIAGVAGRKATVNFTDLARQEARAPLAPRTPKVFHSPMPGPKEPGDKVSRVAAQAEAGPAPLSPAPASSFLALADDTTAVPPDTQGAVGPNHLMTVLNTQVRIQSRTGVVLSTVSLDFFWASVGNPSAFDPKITYDPYGGRWIFAAGANGGAQLSGELIEHLEILRRAEPTPAADDDRGVLEVGLRPARAVAVVVRREVVGDPDQPGPERPPVRLGQRPGEVTVRLEEGLLGEVLGVVVVPDPVIAVAVDVPQVQAVELRELAVELGLLGGRAHAPSLLPAPRSGDAAHEPLGRRSAHERDICGLERRCELPAPFRALAGELDLGVAVRQ